MDRHLVRQLTRLQLAAALALTAWQADVVAEVPRVIHYQGRLTESDGSPLVGQVAVTLRLYDAASEGTALWEETHTIRLTRQDNGVFSVPLGDGTPFPAGLTFDDPLWISTEVNGEGELSPRQLLSAVTYALNASTLRGLAPDELLAQAGAGDITGVTAGAGLTGGGDSADVSLAVGAGAGILVVDDLIAVNAGTAPGQLVQLDADAALPAVSGANLTSLQAASLTGTINAAQLPADTSYLGGSIESGEVTDGTLTAADTADGFLSAGAGINVTKSGEAWVVGATGGGASANHASAASASAVELPGSGTTDLLSVSLTPQTTGAAVLVIATVQLTHKGNPNQKLVTLQLARGGTVLDGSYQVRLGTGARAVSEIAATLHAYDTPGAGTHTYTLRGGASDQNAEAGRRRLTVLELP